MKLTPAVVFLTLLGASATGQQIVQVDGTDCVNCPLVQSSDPALITSPIEELTAEEFGEAGDTELVEIEVPVTTYRIVAIPETKMVKQTVRVPKAASPVASVATAAPKAASTIVLRSAPVVATASAPATVATASSGVRVAYAGGATLATCPDCGRLRSTNGRTTSTSFTHTRNGGYSVAHSSSGAGGPPYINSRPGPQPPPLPEFSLCGIIQRIRTLGQMRRVNRMQGRIERIYYRGRWQ